MQLPFPQPGRFCSSPIRSRNSRAIVPRPAAASLTIDFFTHRADFARRPLGFATAADGRLANVLIAHITDTHVRRNGDERRYLSEALAAIETLAPRPDVILLTGDTTDDGRADQYAVLGKILAACRIPLYLVPGNHDRRATLRAQLPDIYFPGVRGERIAYAIETFAVRLIGLETTLDDAPQRPTLLFMHHPPFRTGVNAADVFGWRGLRRLTAAVTRRPAVQRLIAGHIHCDRRAAIGSALALTTHSTAPQTVPEVCERRLIGMRPESPGFALHAWKNETFTTTSYVNAGDGRFVERAEHR
jgi:3',5'-cyclic AMP phosphodiesterase CpdA